MKKFVVIVVFSLMSVIGYWFYQPEDDRPCIEDWAAQTSSFFSNAGAFLSNIKLPTSEPKDTVDEALEALLPSDTIDLRYQPETLDTQNTAQLDAPLLPNLFEKKQAAPATKVSGQVHRDDDDKIIGAELQVAIPTN